MEATHLLSLEGTSHACEQALRAPDLQRVRDALIVRGLTDEALGVVRGLSEGADSAAPLRRIKAALGESAADASLERFLIVAAALDALPRVATLPVADAVKIRLLDEFHFYAAAPQDSRRHFEMNRATFVAMAKTATLRRFPAGQFDWEVSGISRRYLLAVRPHQLPATLAFATFRMRGIQPVFFSHLNWRRAEVSLREEEANRSYYRMARSLERQPHIKGFAACSWFRSPETHRVSPHLAWLSRVFVENGGFVIEAGAENPEGGVLHRSERRRQLYRSGDFRPTRGLVMWPRAAMLEWARQHPELED
jgi:hypothetical protein